MIQKKPRCQIIPAINVKTFEALKERLKLIESFGVSWAHVDVSDGIFTDFISFNDPILLRDVKTPLSLEAHLMTFEPEHSIEKWIRSGVKRIIFHHEATYNREEIIKKVRTAGLELGIALKPFTPRQFIKPFISQIDLVQILGVNPGPSGQDFKGGEIVNKIKELRNAYPKTIIEVDGGVNDKNAKMLIEAGASLLVAGSSIFDSEDPKKAFEKLQSIIQ